MTTSRLFALVVDTDDHIALARWWADALDLNVTGERDDEAWIEVPDSPELIFVPVPEPKATKNRIHLDLVRNDHEASVARFVDLGAHHVDIGQGDVAWEVLADPAGNEFCIVANTTGEEVGPIGAIAHDAIDPFALGRFWSVASGWPIVIEGEWGLCLRSPTGRGPYLTFGGGTERTAPKPKKNRIHLDVAPFANGDHEAAVNRLVGLGARKIDIGQGDVPWVVLADPEDNEFCVLTPR